jgi:hypothetical protein
MIKIPKAVREEAKIGNEMVRNGYAGGTETGINRGYQLEHDTHISLEDAKVMRAWFARHLYTSRPGYLKWIDDGSPVEYIPGKKNGYRSTVAWLIWGGDEAYEWISSPSVEKMLEKNGYNKVVLPEL